MAAHVFICAAVGRALNAASNRPTPAHTAAFALGIHDLDRYIAVHSFRLCLSLTIPMPRTRSQAKTRALVNPRFSTQPSGLSAPQT